MEDYHQCIKTGCRLEDRQVQSADRLIRRLGLVVATGSPFAAPAGSCSERPGAACSGGPRYGFARHCGSTGRSSSRADDHRSLLEGRCTKMMSKSTLGWENHAASITFCCLATHTASSPSPEKTRPTCPVGERWMSSASPWSTRKTCGSWCSSCICFLLAVEASSVLTAAQDPAWYSTSKCLQGMLAEG